MIALLVAWAIGTAGSAATAGLSWQPWQHLAGVFDLAGPRSDGRLVAAGAGGLSLVSLDGTITPVAIGPDGYHGASGAEAYLDVSPGLHVAGSGCDFARDDIFIIRPTAPLGVTRVDPSGRATNFTNIAGVDSLNGIVFDRVGRFDHRLLVAGPHAGRLTVLAIDCKAGIVPITTEAPPAEGGLAVAPIGFGAHAGELITPDELTGSVWTITASGDSRLLVASGIAHGGDIGVESAAFVPSGFIARGGGAFLADRATANNPHPGTDTILRMPSNDLAAAGVRDGDLLIASEGGGVTIRVRCTSTCAATTIVPTQTSAHIEGHLLIVASQPTPSPSTLVPVADLGSQRAQLLTRLAIGVLIAIAALALLGIGVRRARRR
jgi:hypothetical protein